MRIWKYTIEIVDLQFIEMPIGAKILTAQMQNGDLQIWAIVDELKEKVYNYYKKDFELFNYES